MDMGNRRMFGRSKTNNRSTNQNELFSKIQQRAYQIYEKRGFTHGNDMKDWLEAERQVKRELSIK